MPRRPALIFDYAWCFYGADSVRGSVRNAGGWAYQVVVTLEGRNGVQDVRLDPGRVPVWGPSETGTPFASVVRDSSGLIVVPRILKIRWEDYGGIRDSVVSPAFTHAWRLCN